MEWTLLVDASKQLFKVTFRKPEDLLVLKALSGRVCFGRSHTLL